MAQLLGLAFLGLLVVAHAGDVDGEVYERPLSMFRDFEPRSLGDALFGLLLLFGAATIRTAWRVGSWIDVAAHGTAMVLLAAVAVTPSMDGMHLMYSLAVMFFTFGYYGWLLYTGGEWLWLALHYTTPTTMVFLAQDHGYGLWQKGMIVYFVVATIVRERVLARWLSHGVRRGRGRSRFVRIVVARRNQFGAAVQPKLNLES